MTVPSDRRWEHFPHQGDVGVRGLGPSKAIAFEQAACGLVAIVADPAAVTPHQHVSLRCNAPNDDMLLVDWLNALIFEMDTRGLLFSRFEVRIEAGVLTAEAWGEAIDPARHALGTQVKGATYTCLAVDRRPDGAWRAQCVVDV